MAQYSIELPPLATGIYMMSYSRDASGRAHNDLGDCRAAIAKKYKDAPERRKLAEDYIIAAGNALYAQTLVDYLMDYKSCERPDTIGLVVRDAQGKRVPEYSDDPTGLVSHRDMEISSAQAKAAIEFIGMHHELPIEELKMEMRILNKSAAGHMALAKTMLEDQQKFHARSAGSSANESPEMILRESEWTQLLLEWLKKSRAVTKQAETDRAQAYAIRNNERENRLIREFINRGGLDAFLDDVPQPKQKPPERDPTIDGALRELLPPAPANSRVPPLPKGFPEKSPSK